MPDFTIIFFGQEPETKNGVAWTRFRYGAQPPKKTSFDPFHRTPAIVWPKVNSSVASYGITFRAAEDNRPLATYYGGKQDNMETFWFDLPSDAVPPSYVYLDVKPPRTNKEYKSNQAETTL